MGATSRVLKDVFGFESFRPGQEEVVAHLIAGESVLTVMPTGAGKSLCFQVPALALGGLTLVVSPLVALMQDQVAGLQLAGVAAGTINSARSRAENIETWREVAAGRIRLLYLSPERLMTARMLAALSKLSVRLLAVDEAHCISQWGPAFRPEYEDLSRLKEVFPGVPIVALTASADALTREDVMARLFDGKARCMVMGFDRPNIRLTVAAKFRPTEQLLAFMESHRGDSGIVYCLSRKKAEATAALLVRNGYDALAYHAGMDKAARDANQNTFMTAPSVVMVATIAFGMGIDKADVRFIFHTDLPGSIEAYYQEIGRAGRDGGPARAHMLYGLDDIRLRRLFIEEENSAAERKRREHKRLDVLISYCESPTCRRQALLAYFGESRGPCGNCDLCLNPVALVEGDHEGRALLTAVRLTGERFGAMHIIDVLRGTVSEKVEKAGHDKLACFGSGAQHSKTAWQSLVRQAVATGFLQLDIQGYGGLTLTPKGQALLQGTERFFYRNDFIGRQKTSRRSSEGGRKHRDAADLTAEQSDLLARLKSLRLKLAKARGIPAYLVFADRSLIEMARDAPRSREAFAQVSGVGKAKLKEFCDPFLEVIAAQKTEDLGSETRAAGSMERETKAAHLGSG